VSKSGPEKISGPFFSPRISSMIGVTAIDQLYSQKGKKRI
jgi:hypothetical protein